MAIMTSNIQAALKPVLNKVFTDQLKGPAFWEQFFEQSTTKDAYIDDQEYAGLGTMPVKSEGATMAIDSIQEGYAKRYNILTYALRMQVSEEAIEDNKYPQILDGAKFLAHSARKTQEYDGANVFIRAFNSSYVGSDAVSLCSSSHLLPKGGTYSNMLSTAMSLSETALETVIVAVAKLPGPNGILEGYQVKQLAIPKDLWFRANRILKSEQQNDTANNAINVLKGMGIEINANPFFTSASNWWAGTDAPVGMRWVWRRKPRFDQTNVESALVKEFTGSQRYANGWTNPRCVYGSNA